MRRNLKIRPNFDGHSTIKKAEDVAELLIYFGDSVFEGLGETFINLRKLLIGPGRICLITRQDFFNMKKLESLFLSENRIKFASEDVFWDLRSLERLDIDDCKIEKLPRNLFKNLKKLKEIYLGGNKLTHLQKNLFTDNLQLDYVSLAGNKLQTINVDFTKLPKIKYIDLSYNICINKRFSPEYPEESTVATVQELQFKIANNCT
jgi:Leucine-rich repeat (LRR) protein